MLGRPCAGGLHGVAAPLAVLGTALLLGIPCAACPGIPAVCAGSPAETAVSRWSWYVCGGPAVVYMLLFQGILLAQYSASRLRTGGGTRRTGRNIRRRAGGRISGTTRALLVIGRIVGNCERSILGLLGQLRGLAVGNIGWLCHALGLMQFVYLSSQKTTPRAAGVVCDSGARGLQTQLRLSVVLVSGRFATPAALLGYAGCCGVAAVWRTTRGGLFVSCGGTPRRMVPPVGVARSWVVPLPSGAPGLWGPWAVVPCGPVRGALPSGKGGLDRPNVVREHGIQEAQGRPVVRSPVQPVLVVPVVSSNGCHKAVGHKAPLAWVLHGGGGGGAAPHVGPQLRPPGCGFRS